MINKDPVLIIAHVYLEQFVKMASVCHLELRNARLMTSALQGKYVAITNVSLVVLSSDANKDGLVMKEFVIKITGTTVHRITIVGVDLTLADQINVAMILITTIQNLNQILSHSHSPQDHATNTQIVESMDNA